MALYFRSFYALGRSALTTRQGMPTGAIYGAALFLNKLIQEERPDYLVAVTENKEKPTFRHEMYKAYKATRDKMPDDLARQLPHLAELLAAFNIKLVSMAGVEADDVIGAAARQLASEELDVYIVSGDKDFMQVIGPHVRLYAPKKDEAPLVIDTAGVKERYGCTPEQMIDLLAIVGDSSDNVPGVAGIGEKGAAKLVETYGSLEGIYAHLNEISAKKQRESLERDRDAAFLSRQLVTLKTDIELPFKLDEVACDPATATTNDALIAFYQRFELRSLAEKASERRDAVQSGDPAPVTAATTVETVKTSGDTGVLGVLKALVSSPSLYVAIDASGTDLVNDRLQTIALAGDSGAVHIIDVRSELPKALANWLGVEPRPIYGHGLKPFVGLLQSAGCKSPPRLIDLEVADYLLDPNNYDHGLASLALKHGADGGMRAAAELADAPSHVAVVRAVAPSIMTKIKDKELGRVLHDIEMPLMPVLTAMERAGVYVDSEFLDAYSHELHKLVVELEERIYKEAGGPFNINSPKQLQELLFEKLKLQDELGIKRLKRTKTGYSTDESVLSQLSAHPVPRAIIEYRTVAKLKNTYVDTLPQFINKTTGRIHTSFNQTVAATGRLSCDRPNLQNIPMRSAIGRKIRAAFRPDDDGWRFISADYSQVELRLLAHLAKAEPMMEAFRQGLDVHTVTAAKIFNLKESDVDPVARSRAKAVNFGIIYGMGPQRLAAETGVTMTEAKDFITRYFEVYPEIKRYTESLIELARKRGYTITMTGRRRPIPDIGDRNRAVAVRAENIAVNAPIQGSAADLIKLAMIKVSKDFATRGMKTKMLLQVHDELVFSAPESEVEAASAVIRNAMETALPTDVPLKVELKTGRNWLEAH
jgi:DNA polymerase-1